jgi:hypothetical protein
MDAEKLVKTYITIRDARDAVARKRDEEVAQLQSQLDELEAALLEICKETGQEGGKTSAGTFTRSIKTRYETTDWDHLFTFINKHQAPELLEKRIHQGNMKQFLEENPDKLPEGLNVRSRYSITIRRAK